MGFMDTSFAHSLHPSEFICLYLAFVGTVELSLAAYVGALARPDNITVTIEELKSFWRGGISFGDWQALGRKSARVMRQSQRHPAVDGFASLWFKGRGTRESDFASTTRNLVGLRNEAIHRGPRTPYEFEQRGKELQKLIDGILKQLSLFIQYPLRLVHDMNIDWRTSEAVLRTFLYTGDHPGLRQELVTLSEPLPKGKLYLTVSEDVWVPLYPLINVQYCSQCGWGGVGRSGMCPVKCVIPARAVPLFSASYPATNSGCFATRSSVRSSFASDPALKYRLPTCHSSCCSESTAPTSRITAASFGKIPTTLVLLLTSLLSLSSGLLDQTFCQCSAGRRA